MVTGITCPVPPETAPDTAGGRVYVKFQTPDQAKSAFMLMNGRQFDGNTVLIPPPAPPPPSPPVLFSVLFAKNVSPFYLIQGR